MINIQWKSRYSEHEEEDLQFLVWHNLNNAKIEDNLKMLNLFISRLVEQAVDTNLISGGEVLDILDVDYYDEPEILRNVA